MAGTAYHMEALRKARVIERKTEAMKQLQEGLGQDGCFDATPMEQTASPLVFSEPGHYAQTREILQNPAPQTERKKFIRRRKDDTIRKPTPESVKSIPRDQVYAILHPCNKKVHSERIRHRRCRAENEGEDKVMPLMNPPEYDFKVPFHDLPPRKPHFKV